MAGAVEATDDRVLAEATEIDDLLTIGASALDASIGYITRLTPDGEHQIIVESIGAPEQLTPGHSWPLAVSFCRETVEADELVVAEAPSSASIRPTALEGYCGMALRSNGACIGTVCFGRANEPLADPSPRTRDRLWLIRRLVEDTLRYRRARDGFRSQSDRLAHLASTASHDLRNPLTVATGRLELAKSDCDSEHLPPIERGLERLNAIIEGMVRTVREGEVAGDRHLADLDVIAASTDAKFEGNGEMPAIVADPVALRRLVDIVAEHAGTPEKVLTLGRIEHGFYIEHDGPRIPEERRQRVFELDASRETVGGEADLVIAHQICRAHEWEIEAIEGPQGGTRFEITNVTFAAPGDT